MSGLFVISASAIDVLISERAVQAKVAIDEQTRLQQLEAEKLNDKAKTIKKR